MRYIIRVLLHKPEEMVHGLGFRVLSCGMCVHMIQSSSLDFRKEGSGRRPRQPWMPSLKPPNRPKPQPQTLSPIALAADPCVAYLEARQTGGSE